MTPKQKCIEDMILVGAEMAHLIRVLRTAPQRLSELGIKTRTYSATSNWDGEVMKYRKLTKKKATR